MEKKYTKIYEYIELVNNGYIPKTYDNLSTFKDGEAINYFWYRHKYQIINILNSDSKYEVGYDKAKEIAFNLENETPKQMKIKMKITEYIELLNRGYMPKSRDIKTKFTNGDLINTFWAHHKDKIIDILNNDPKYKIGYETAKEIVQIVAEKVEDKILTETPQTERIKEYIELLNNGYIPKTNDNVNSFTDGKKINRFWESHKDKIIATLDNAVKYQTGYEQAKDTLDKLRNENPQKVSINQKMDEYIELMNKGYIPKTKDNVNHFADGKKIGDFWFNHRNEIVIKLNNDPKYQEDYETAKMMVQKKKLNEPNKLKISKIQILKYLGIELKKETDNLVEDIIKIACFKQNVSAQNAWIKEAYQDTLNKLDKLDILDEDKISSIITHEIIDNCLEKEEREEFKKAVLSYLEKVKELQKLDVAFEDDNQKRSEKIKKYNFDEFDIEECVLISLEFNQAKFIEPTTDLSKRRKLISSYIIDWNELTDLEKEEIIKQNNFTIDEISLINEKQEEIKVLKKLR